MEQLFVLATRVEEHNRNFFYIASKTDGVQLSDELDKAAHYTSLEAAQTAQSVISYPNTNLVFVIETHGFWSLQ